MNYYTILTNIGKAKLANAIATNTKLEISLFGVGDGNGNEYLPEESQTSLKNEKYKSELNGLYVDEKNINYLVAEGLIPSDIGNFTIREVGLYDLDGEMIAIGSYPSTYKPTLQSGAAKDVYIKIIIEVSNSNAVTLKIDPSVVLSTRDYVDRAVSMLNNKIDSIDIQPIGATYIQFPTCPTPSTLFGGTWNLIFADEGVFFRTEGKNASDFDSGIQQESLPNITGSFGAITGTTGYVPEGSGAFTRVAKYGTGYNGGGGRGDGASIGFDASSSHEAYGTRNEVAPENRTIRIWQRTA